MADLVQLTDSRGSLVTQVLNHHCRIVSKLAVSTGVTRGYAVYYDANGRAAHAAAGTAGKQQFKGIALNDAGDGVAVDVLEEGYVTGYEISALAYDAVVFLSDTAGTLGTTAGTMTVTIGRVEPLSDRDPATGKPSKVLRIDNRGMAKFA